MVRSRKLEARKFRVFRFSSANSLLDSLELKAINEEQVREKQQTICCEREHPFEG